MNNKDEYYPIDFINVNTQIKTKISGETDEMIEYITNLNPTITYDYDCPKNEKGQNCSGGKYKTEKTNIFFNFDESNKRMFVVNKYGYDCKCDFSFKLE